MGLNMKMYALKNIKKIKLKKIIKKIKIEENFLSLVKRVLLFPNNIII